MANSAPAESSFNSNTTLPWVNCRLLREAFPASLRWNEPPPDPASPWVPWSQGSAQDGVCARMAPSSPTHSAYRQTPPPRTAVPMSSPEDKLLTAGTTPPLGLPLYPHSFWQWPVCGNLPVTTSQARYKAGRVADTTSSLPPSYRNSTHPSESGRRCHHQPAGNPAFCFKATNPSLFSRAPPDLSLRHRPLPLGSPITRGESQPQVKLLKGASDHRHAQLCLNDQRNAHLFKSAF